MQLLLRNSIIEGNEDIDYYYLHLKGVTRISQPTEDWRNMMLHFLLQDVEGNSMLLDKYDAIGCNFCSGVPKENIGIHYSGNFWATRSKHIKKLALLKEMKNRYGRLGAEFWIGSSNKSANYYEFHSSKINHYISLYPPSEYIGSTAAAAYTI